MCCIMPAMTLPTVLAEMRIVWSSLESFDSTEDGPSPSGFFRTPPETLSQPQLSGDDGDLLLVRSRGHCPPHSPRERGYLFSRGFPIHFSLCLIFGGGGLL